jgi:energy-coupling factor transporter ATP-binding protein EcfA2
MTDTTDTVASGRLHLQRLQVEQLRRFRAPLVLADLEPGLTIVAGPNEAGKSTLVRAIRAAFFERHRSTAVDDLRPWGDSAAAPTVTLDYQLGGQPHRLVKSFLGKKRCHLSIGTRQLEGVEAEDHLAQQFGFSFALKGASRAEHWGIPGLLWVEQGTGQALDVGHARSHLHDALQGRAGDDPAAALAASGGDALLDQLRQQRGALLTATGKPRAALAEAMAQAEALQAELATLDAQVIGYRQQVDQLATLRQQQQADEAARPAEAAAAALAQAQQQQQALQADGQRLAEDQARLAQLARTRELLLAQLATQAEQQAAATQRAKDAATAAAALAAIDTDLAQARARWEAAQAGQRQAQAAARQARQQAAAADLQRAAQAAQAQAARLGEALQQALAAQQRLDALRQAPPGAPLSAGQVQALRTLERQARDAALRHQAVATRLQYRLAGGVALVLDRAGTTQPLQGDGEALLDGPATLQLPGLGTLTITPGGQDLPALAQAHERADEALRSALQRHGLPDLAAADARLAALADHQSQLALAEQALAIVAPQGLDALRSAAASAQATASQAHAALAAAGPLDANAPPPNAAQAEAALEAAQAAEQQAAAALAATQQQQAVARGRRDDAQRESDASNALLADPQRAERAAQAQQQLLATQAEQAALAAQLALAQARLQAARPDIVAQDIVRLQRSVQQLHTAQQQQREQVLLLENTLQQAGVQDLEERRELAAGALAQAQRRMAELQRRANALALLCERLEAQRAATLTRLQAPLQQRLQHYLPLLLPGARLQVADDLAPGTLTRPGDGGAPETAAVDALSFGAREQLGLISRFAYADLLQQAGRPTLLILDDALVHSDTGRLAQMKRVVFDAAQRHQLLLFTCHPELWRDMGVAVRQLP